MDTTRICSIDGCERGGKLIRGWCQMHYTRFWKHGDPLKVLRRLDRPNRNHDSYCSVDDCNRPYLAKGYCVMHYARFRQHGDPLVIKQAPSGTGYITKNGYRRIMINGKRRLEHDIVAERMIGRPLLPTEDVHHKGGAATKLDNREENLEVMLKSDHTRMHNHRKER